MSKYELPRYGSSATTEGPRWTIRPDGSKPHDRISPLLERLVSPIAAEISSGGTRIDGIDA